MNTIEAQNVCLGYGTKVIVDQLSLTIPQGQITTLIGPNGSGKSTLIRSIAHLLKPTTGVILLDHQNIQHIKSKAFAKKIAVLPQTNQAANDLTVDELVTFGRLPYRHPLSSLSATDHEKIEWALTQASLRTSAIGHSALYLVGNVSVLGLPWPSLKIPRRLSWMNRRPT